MSPICAKKVEKRDLLSVLSVAFEATSFLEGQAHDDEYELERVGRMNKKLHEVWHKYFGDLKEVEG